MNATAPAPEPAARAHGPWWIAAAVYFVATCLLHLQFSLWLVRPRETPWGRHALSELMPAAIVVGGVLLALLVLRQLRRAPRPAPLAAGWLLWLLAVAAIDRWLTFSANEYFHYPQYALLAWLVARALDPARDHPTPGRVLFWVTLAGAADEVLQYLWITTNYSDYLDFNDMLVNLVAGAGGLLLYYGQPPNAAAAPRKTRRGWRAEGAAIVALLLAAGTAIAAGRLALAPAGEVPPGGVARDTQGRATLYLQRSIDQYGRWHSGPRRGHYRVLTPDEALAALLLAGAAFTALLRAAAGGATQPGEDTAATISPSSAGKSR